jgi:isopentenyl-diphosphate Delta-isomerase
MSTTQAHVSPGRLPVDVVDADGHPTGHRVSLNHATGHGLPFRAVHIIIHTADDLVLIEKRSGTIVFAPGLLDIGLGGVVDAGESPAAAAVRELREELGIKATQSQLRYLGTTPYHHRWPHYHKHVRVFTHSYALELPTVPAHLQLQAQEVANAWFIPLSSAQRLLQRHSLKPLGQLLGRYRYYHWLLRQLASLPPNHR